MWRPAGGSFFSLLMRPLILPVVPAPANGGITSRASAAKARRYSTDALRDMTRLLSEATRVSGQGEGPWIPATNPLKGGKNFGKWGLGGIVHIYMTRLVLGSAGARETPF